MTRAYGILGGDSCIMPHQIADNRTNGYVSPGHITTYTLSPEELAEIQRKYGPPGKPPPKEVSTFISAPKQLSRNIKNSASVTGQKPKRPKRERKRTIAAKDQAERKPRPCRREDPSAEEMNAALKLTTTVRKAARILQISEKRFYELREKYGIKTVRQLTTEAKLASDTKYCPDCKQTLPKTKFTSHNTACDKKQPICSDCHNKRRRERRARKRAEAVALS